MNVFKRSAITMAFVSSQVTADECVILMHGLARSSSSMERMATALDNSGFLTVNYGYPSTEYPIDKLAGGIANALTECPNNATVHFVTHSLGGILVRQYLTNNSIENMGRVVMLGPPNRGSHLVDKLHDVPGYRLINGPAGMQLGTERVSIPNMLGPANFELGVIAGTRSINLILSTMLPNPHDGKVSVENTKLDGMADHISLPVTHPFMMKNQKVINQVIYFLKHGAFKRP
jgi:hypothetical protein